MLNNNICLLITRRAKDNSKIVTYGKTFDINRHVSYFFMSKIELITGMRISPTKKQNYNIESLV